MSPRKLTKKQKEASRKKSLGELGELFAIKALVDNDFDKIKNLNDIKMNYSYIDLYAEKKGKKYFISVKSRNKYQKDGNLNARYNIKISKKSTHWMAIQFETNTYSIYFGAIKQLNGKGGILMGDKYLPSYECFAKNKRHYFDFDFYKNN